MNDIIASCLGASTVLTFSVGAAAQPAPVSPSAGGAPKSEASLAPTTPSATESSEGEASRVAGTPLKVSGSFFGRYEARQGYARLGVSRQRWLEGDLAVYRARLVIESLPADVGRGLSAAVRFAPQASGSHGQLDSTVQDAALGLHEGYLRLARGSSRFDLGRFEMNYGDALVIGNLGWHQTARSFDGGRLHVQGCETGAWFDLFLTQLDEGIALGDGRNGAGDLYFAGAYADVGPLLSDGLALDLYELNQIRLRSSGVPLERSDPAAGTGRFATAVQATLGARAKQTLGLIDYRVEAGYQLGQRAAVDNNIDVSAYQVDAELGVRPLKAFRASVEGFLASGDDPTTAKAEGYDHLYPTAHKWLGLADIIGARTNVYGAALHLSGQVTQRLALRGDVQSFFRHRHMDDVDAYAGTELDAGAKYSVGDGVTTSALYALFLPSEEAYGRDDIAQYFELQLGYGF